MTIYSTLSRINDDLHWRYHHFSKNPQKISGDGWIAPSCNLLQPTVFKNRKTIQLTSKYVQTVAEQNQLIVPTHFKTASMTNHCVSMSLNFIKKLSDHQTVEQAARAMQQGADEDCARCSIAYAALYKANSDAKDKPEVLLNKLRNAAANIFGLSLDKELNLNMPLNEMSDYLKNRLVNGKYLIRLPGHLVTLVKNEGGLFLYDSNQGTINLKKDEQFLVQFLKKYQIQFTERLTLIHVTEKSDAPQLYQTEEIISEADRINPPKITCFPLSPPSKKWEIVQLTFRGKIYNFVKNKENGLIYNGDSKKLIRFKCAVLTVRIASDTAVRMVHHASMTIFRSFELVFRVFIVRKGALECAKKIKQSFFDIFRAPLFGIGLAGAAAYGIRKPYEGREWYGYLERCLNRQNDRVNPYSKYYAAPCFVPLNFNGTDRNNETEQIAILKKHAIKIQNIQKRYCFQLCCGWTKGVLAP